MLEAPRFTGFNNDGKSWEFLPENSQSAETSSNTSQEEAEGPTLPQYTNPGGTKCSDQNSYQEKILSAHTTNILINGYMTCMIYFQLI